jgi:CheY-like chemotaxis protein
MFQPCHEFLSRWEHLIYCMDVLFVEDNEGDILLIEEAVEEHQEVIPHIIKDGKEAIDYLDKKGNYSTERTPDLIFLDVNLPRLSGHEILKYIKRNTHLQQVPVIMFTTSSWADDYNRAYQNGANCYVTKPAGALDFIKAVSTSLNFWSHVARLPSGK